MSHDLRMLVLVLDGTTLDAAGALRPADVAAAHRLREAGIHVTIATRPSTPSASAGWR